MDGSQPGRVGIVRRTWRGLDATRRFALNVIFFGIVIGLIVAVGSGGKPSVPKGCALVLKPVGSIVEQLDGNAVDRARAELLGGGSDQTLLKDLVDAIDSAREDKRVKALVLDLDEHGGRRDDQARGPEGRHRALQEVRQEGHRHLRRVRPVRLLPRGPGRRGLAAPHGHGPARGLLPLCHVLQGRPRQARNRVARLPGRASTSRRSSPTSATTCPPRRRRPTSPT